MNPKEDYLLIENVDRCDFHPVCVIYGEGKKQEANAQLIAAAPELLEALRVAHEWIYEAAKDNTEALKPLRAIMDALQAATPNTL